MNVGHTYGYEATPTWGRPGYEATPYLMNELCVIGKELFTVRSVLISHRQTMHLRKQAAHTLELTRP